MRRAGDLLAMDFPARAPKPCPPNPALVEALGRAPKELLGSNDILAVYESEEEVRALAPDMKALTKVGKFVIVTATGRGADFVSRFFAPCGGIDEDPVTGRAHSTLVPYWAARLGKSKLHAFQVSKRGGELWLEDRGERVGISGSAALYMEGTISV